MPKTSHKRAGFTLPEVMIVILIIGILLAIALPTFAKARARARLEVILANMKRIEGAREMCYIEQGVGGFNFGHNCTWETLQSNGYWQGAWPHNQPISGAYRPQGARVGARLEVTFRGRTQEQWRTDTTLWDLL
jgi:prepilin-type N-terminal cleavage/methylation domain-containing protein